MKSLIAVLLALLAHSSSAAIGNEEYSSLSSEVTAFQLFTLPQFDDALNTNKARKVCFLWGQMDNFVTRLEIASTRIEKNDDKGMELKQSIESLHQEITVSLKARLDNHCQDGLKLDTGFIRKSLIKVNAKFEEISLILADIARY